MGDSETFGIEKDHGEEVITWLNNQAKTQKAKLEARLYGYTISTKNFGDFEMFSCTHCGFVTRYEVELNTHMRIHYL